MKKMPQKEVIFCNVGILVERIVLDNPFHSNVLKKTLASLELSELHHLEDYIIFCLKRGLSIEYLAECYGTITADVLRESTYFNEHKRYRYSTFAEVASSVYFNDTYMSLYMRGVLITQFFWPNHLALFRFFRETLPNDKPGSYLEVGPGHGYFLMTALERSAYNHFVAIDISETSIGQTKALIDSKHTEKNIECHCADFLQLPMNTGLFDAIVMGEILEHVENPRIFLQKISTLANKDAYIFVTTCINAPMIDHIYLFNNKEQVAELFADCGFRIKEQLILPYVGKTLEESEQQLLTINVGYVLEKK